MSTLPLLFLALLIFRLVFISPPYQNGDSIRVNSRVVGEPKKFINFQRIRLEGLDAYLPLYPEIKYGDRIIVEGKVEDRKLEEAKLIKIVENSNPLFLFREKMLNVFKRSLPEPSAGLLSGVVLGSKTGLSDEFWQKLRKTGTAHVVVASGMNISFVGQFLLAFLVSWIPRRKALLIAIFGVWIYAFLSGFDAPIVRAAIMGTIGFVGQEIGRLSFAGRSLAISALIMLIAKPEWVRDIGFILSFVATTSILVFEKKIRGFLKSVPLFLREGLSTSLAAQIGVAPIIFVTFGDFNLLSPLINAFVLWTVPPMMVIGVLGALAGVFVPFVGRIFLYFAYPLTYWFVKVIEYAS